MVHHYFLRWVVDMLLNIYQSISKSKYAYELVFLQVWSAWTRANLLLNFQTCICFLVTYQPRHVHSMLDSYVLLYLSADVSETKKVRRMLFDGSDADRRLSLPSASVRSQADAAVAINRRTSDSHRTPKKCKCPLSTKKCKELHRTP